MSNAFLIQWNPAKWSPDKVNAMIAAGRSDDTTDEGWSFASHRAARVGDDVYVRRSGDDRPGIILRGRISGFSEPRPALDNNTLRHHVFFMVEKAVDANGPPLIAQADLDQIDPDQHWTNQSSGISLSPEAAAWLGTLTDAPIVEAPTVEGSAPPVHRRARRGVGSY